ncbi:MAG: 16S rRNA (guanine(966)-N(2))-methyltransferase RsmD [Acetobacteraceae bacterium]|nr:16S rRNA (guanine(966)-N(2))-methyltransferase RsmD [Acetobacteraceae bacterium]
MRIVAGQWRGRGLIAPSGQTTRPTSERMRQAVFDMLAHAPWAEGCLHEAEVLDVFAGTGALGLEALSRGAKRAHFIEQDRAALTALKANLAACKAGERGVVLPIDARKPPRGTACMLVFLDPPYGRALIPTALPALNAAGWIAAHALIVAETAEDEILELPATMVAERRHGAGVTRFFRWTS